MKKYIHSLYIALLVLLVLAEPVSAQNTNQSPVKNFEHFWKTFSEHYGLFQVKGIRWDDVFEKYRPMVAEQTTDGELYRIFTEMILVLNDNHVNLYPTNGTLPVFPGGVVRRVNGKMVIKKVQDDFDLDVVKRYLIDFKEATPNVQYGKLPGNIGYLNIKGTDSRKVVKSQMAAILNYLSDANSLIIDIRAFYGGADAISQLIASHFTSSRKLYMTTRKRSGPGQNEFTAPVEWCIEPAVTNTFTKPIIVLTSNFTQSAGETFLFAMDELDHVKTLGDTSAGSFSDNPTFELPNGWMFSLSVGDFRNAKGESLEGTGIAPDEHSVTTKEELLELKDSVLEKAVEDLDLLD